MKEFLRFLIPNFLLVRYHQFKITLKRHRETNNNKRKTTEEVFTAIYVENKWGGAKGEFYSGPGTMDGRIVSPYISMLSKKAAELGFNGLKFVDLGCGNFFVGQQLLPLCSSYVGVDVVKLLIERNQEQFGSENIKFRHLNIVEDELPDGDICFIRQVLQHLSNEQIILILEKLGKYKYIFITEHYPADNNKIRHNIDKIHGADIRVKKNSGIYLTMPPFELPVDSLKLVLEVPNHILEEDRDKEYIRTYLYIPQNIN